MANFYLSHHSI